MEIKKYAVAALLTMTCTAFGAYIHSRYVAATQTTVAPVAQTTEPTRAMNTSFFTSAAPTDFTDAAEMTINGVVHVKIMQENKQNDMYGGGDIFDFFFGPQYRRGQRQEPVVGSGSGVIVSADGYIVTNNHVVEGADKIEVVLNDKRSFEATLIGTDPTTDIAVIKIEATDLHPLSFGNSDNLKVGEWVLAVGNPFNLTSTVTAGIVSAKGRHVGINTSNMAIESFIQTDAAVNPGNSGGALVNTRGQVIGINTAIYSQTGSFTGYSFAVPSNIVSKVADDLKTYGEVQRALLGVQIQDVNTEIQKRLNLSTPDGVLVAGVSDGGAALEAGIKTDDVIVSIDGEKVHSSPDLQSKIAQHRPGDAVKISAIRDGKTKDFVVTLRNIRGTTGVIKSGDNQLLGAKLEKLSDTEAEKMGLRYGLKVSKLEKGKLKDAGVKEGFIIVKANRQPVTSVADFQQIVASTQDGLFLSGFYSDGRMRYYAIDLTE